MNGEWFYVYNMKAEIKSNKEKTFHFIYLFFFIYCQVLLSHTSQCFHNIIGINEALR